METKTANTAHDEDSVAFSATTSSTNELSKSNHQENGYVPKHKAFNGTSRQFKQLVAVLDSGASDHMVNDKEQ